MRMLNGELRRLQFPQLPAHRAFCSRNWYKCLYATGRTSLDRICEKFEIDVSHRSIHGALLDSEILAKMIQKLWEITPELNEKKEEVVVPTDGQELQQLEPGGGAKRRRSRKARKSVRL